MGFEQSIESLLKWNFLSCLGKEVDGWFLTFVNSIKF